MTPNRRKTACRKIGGIAVVFLVLGGLLFMSCSQEPPQILEKFQQLNYRDDPAAGRGYDQLSLFLHVDDEDGYEDLEYLYIVQDEAELFWELDAEEWTYRERDGESWIGSNTIVMADFGPFPEGLYRVILVDKAGERMETEVYLERTPKPPPLPDITTSEDAITLGGPTRRYSLWMYGENGYIGTRETGGRDIRTADLREEGVDHVYFYYYDNDAGRGVVRGPYYL